MFKDMRYISFCSIVIPPFVLLILCTEKELLKLIQTVLIKKKNYK